VRHSVAILSGTPVRLSELTFPARRVHIHRTRVAYIHLDNLLHFAKIDRDGKVDGFIAAYLPDELALLFLKQGEVVTSVAFSQKGREVRPIAVTLRSIREELERGELEFCEAPLEQLVWMYHSAIEPLRPWPADPHDPGPLFLSLQREQFSGVLELIVNGTVSYLRLEDGRFQHGHFAGKRDDESVPAYFQRAFQPGPDGKTVVAAAGFTPGTSLEEQASPAMVQAYREVYWRIAEAAEREVPGEALGRAQKLTDRLVPAHAALGILATPRERELEPRLLTADAITFGLSDWAGQLLEQLEVIAPGVAGQVLKEATRDHRFVLQRAGFYDRLPWPLTW
jgi:hypothetical protein